MENMMKRMLFAGIMAISLVSGIVLQAEASVQVIDLRSDYRENPLGIDVTQPRLSWRIEQIGGRRGIRQGAYQVRVASARDLLEKGEADLWDSGKVESDKNFQVEYAGEALASRTRCYWQVRVWDENGQPSDWSAPARWTMGLLDRDEWRGEWIGYDAAYVLTKEERAENRLFSLGGLPWIEVERGHGRASTPAGFRFRATLPQDRTLEHAVLVMYAFHSCHAWINEKPVGAAFHWEQTARLDVTDAMQAGDNIIALLGDQTDPHQPAIQGKLVM